MTELLYILVLGIIAYVCLKPQKSNTEQLIEEIKKDKKLAQKLFDELMDWLRKMNKDKPINFSQVTPYPYYGL